MCLKTIIYWKQQYSLDVKLNVNDVYLGVKIVQWYRSVWFDRLHLPVMLGLLFWDTWILDHNINSQAGFNHGHYNDF